MKDFYSMTPLDSKLDGNSRKIMVLDKDGIKWMCKFDKMRGNQRMHDSISEHISCTILRFLGYYVQYTEIGELDSETCVYCRIDNKIEQLKSVTSYFTDDRLVYDLDTLLSYTPLKPNICLESFKQHLIERLPMDCILMNVDLHSGNVGFIRDEHSMLYHSYIYDMGGSLLSKYALHDSYTYKARQVKETIRSDKRNIRMSEFIKEHNLMYQLEVDYNMYCAVLLDIQYYLLSESPSMYNDFIINSLVITKERFEELLKEY